MHQKGYFIFNLLFIFCSKSITYSLLLPVLRLSPEFTTGFNRGLCPSFVFRKELWRSLFFLFVLLLFTHCICLSFDLQLLTTYVVSSDYLCGIFWLPMWYLLTTYVVSSDYLCGIFWLPMWYLLITSVVSSDYLCGIFWLSMWYLLTTYVVSSILSSSLCIFV